MSIKNVTYHTDERAVLKLFNVASRLPFVGSKLGKPIVQESIIASAIKLAGSEDFGGDDFLEPLTLLIDSINNEAKLTPAGLFMAANYITSDLVTRLKLVKALRENPDIEAQPVVAPISIVGMPRTGTTFLFEMISSDSRFRVPASWEAERPFPHPEKETRFTDPRIAQSEQTFKIINYLADGLTAMHEIGALLPQECIILQGPSLRSQSYSTVYSVPSYMNWLANCDMSFSYSWHKRLVQYLQYKHSAERWVFKSPAHPGHIEDFLKIYPDAKFVQTHRPLLDVLSSVSSLFCKMRSPYSHHVDPIGVGVEMMKDFGGALNKLVELRAHNSHVNSIFLDLQYSDIIKNPDAAYEAFCEFSGIGLPDGYASNGSNFQRERPQHRNGKHVYKPEWFGLGQEVINNKFLAYNQRHIPDY
jgi:hypothetical protein